MREKLIELLASKPELLKNLNVNISRLFKLADHLIANGVTISGYTTNKFTEDLSDGALD